MIGNPIAPIEKEYMNRMRGDLKQIVASLVIARRAIDKEFGIIKEDTECNKLNSQIYDAVVTAHTLADLLLGDYPIMALWRR